MINETNNKDNENNERNLISTYCLKYRQVIINILHV